MENRIGNATLLVAATAALIALGIEYYVFAIAYPAFGMIGSREFPAIHALHAERITYAIGPALLAAFAANAMLVANRPRGIPVWLSILAAAAGAGILAYTAFVAVPLHARLGDGRQADVIAALNATEWIRASATALQATCDVAMLWIVLRQ